MVFGPIMEFEANQHQIRMAPVVSDELAEFVRDGAMQSATVKEHLSSWYAQVLEDEKEWFERVRRNQDCLIWGVYVREHKSWRLIGTTGFHDIANPKCNPYFKGAVSGCMIFRPEYWGQGIMGHCHKARSWYGLTQPIGLERIISGVYERNTASRKALSGVGYVELFRERNEFFINGSMTSKISLELISPLTRSWNNWWHGDYIPERYKMARKQTLTVISWAEASVRLT